MVTDAQAAGQTPIDLNADDTLKISQIQGNGDVVVQVKLSQLDELRTTALFETNLNIEPELVELGPQWDSFLEWQSPGSRTPSVISGTSFPNVGNATLSFSIPEEAFVTLNGLKAENIHIRLQNDYKVGAKVGELSGALSKVSSSIINEVNKVTSKLSGTNILFVPVGGDAHAQRSFESFLSDKIAATVTRWGNVSADQASALLNSLLSTAHEEQKFTSQDAGKRVSFLLEHSGIQITTTLGNYSQIYDSHLSGSEEEAAKYLQDTKSQSSGNGNEIEVNYGGDAAGHIKNTAQNTATSDDKTYWSTLKKELKQSKQIAVGEIPAVSPMNLEDLRKFADRKDLNEKASLINLTNIWATENIIIPFVASPISWPTNAAKTAQNIGTFKTITLGQYVPSFYIRFTAKGGPIKLALVGPNNRFELVASNANVLEKGFVSFEEDGKELETVPIEGVIPSGTGFPKNLMGNDGKPVFYTTFIASPGVHTYRVKIGIENPDIGGGPDAKDIRIEGGTLALFEM
jgi:hypothetical protein